MTAVAAEPIISLNQATFPQLDVDQILGLAERHGLRAVALWRAPVEARGVARVRELLEDGGFTLTSLCRAGWFTAYSPGQALERAEDNRRAVDEAAELGAQVLPIVCGPPAGRDLAAGRAAAASAIYDLEPYAAERRVRLGIEPLHPVFAAERSVVVTLRQAREIVTGSPIGSLGVVVDTYGTWWDPDLGAELARLGEAIVGLQVADWAGAPHGLRPDRAMPGDGMVDLAGMVAATRQAGYGGPLEIEVLSSRLARLTDDDIDRALDRMITAVRTISSGSTAG